ncbi:hypothetical protein SAMN05216223_11867 [Actinacidiphila yanglinensis]|uniref:Uncharacterized protein n=1 Tax=Actinacidiphila yanglinensis TaxID=310779 RepID=A0A1H6DPP4_9ACTN|nr:hypothetical protein SAMN05216223_11867 [Actinacidiphila yanglinensis]
MTLEEYLGTEYPQSPAAFDADQRDPPAREPQ